MSDQKEPLRPKNNFEMAEMLSEGFTCQVGAKHWGHVVESLDYHKLKADLVVENGMITITPKQK